MLSKPVTDAKKEPNRVLFVMDDFPSIGKMDMFLTNMPYFRGYNICALIIAKSIEHIKNCYGDLATDIITSDCNYKIIYTAHTYPTAEYFAKISDLSSEKLMNLDQGEQILLVDGKKAARSKKLLYYNDRNFDGKILKPAAI
jgi:type IV secretion system protein VirD4